MLKSVKKLFIIIIILTFSFLPFKVPYRFYASHERHDTLKK